MGNIRPTYIKRVAISLVEEYPEIFSKDFQENKETLKQIAEIQSKKLRNRIAGYIVTLMKRQDN